MPPATRLGVCLCRSGEPRGTGQSRRALPIMVTDADGITARDTPALILLASQDSNLLFERVRRYPRLQEDGKDEAP